MKLDTITILFGENVTEQLHVTGYDAITIYPPPAVGAGVITVEISPDGIQWLTVLDSAGLPIALDGNKYAAFPYLSGEQLRIKNSLNAAIDLPFQIHASGQRDY